jgi:hypothetical protein
MGVRIYYKLLEANSLTDEEYVVKIDQGLWWDHWGRCAEDKDIIGEDDWDEHERRLWERYRDVFDYPDLRAMLDHWDRIDQKTLSVY